jgi:hypothetical protein
MAGASRLLASAGGMARQEAARETEKKTSGLVFSPQ